MDKRLKVLVADDDPNTRILLRGSLRKWGYDVVEASDGKQALEALGAGDVRMVVTDWEMPEIDGPTLCSRIRVERAAEYVYVLLLTHHSDSLSIAQGLEAGADDFVSKPFNPLELRARLDVGRRILALHDELRVKNEELTRLNARLNMLAATDPLTKLGNRRSLDEMLERVHEQAKQATRGYGLLVGDVDHFKRVNDTFGHVAGDHVLAQLAELMSKSVRDTDGVFRYGGEEFVIITKEQTVDGIRTMGERLRQALSSARIDVGTGVTISVTISFGGTVYDGDEDIDWAAVLRRADSALYAAKNDGRDRIVTWKREPVPTILGSVVSISPVAALNESAFETLTEIGHGGGDGALHRG